MPDLAELIGAPKGYPDVLLRMATVTATSAGGTATIRFGTGAGTIANVRRLSSASFATNDTVWVLQQGYDLLILGRVAAGAWGAAETNDGLDIYHWNATPYVDFHRAASPAGDANADYNMRIINDAAGQLSVVGGKLAVNSAAGTNVVSDGTGAGYEFATRNNTTSKWVLYADADSARIWRSVGGDLFKFFSDGEMQCNAIGIGGDNTANAGLMIHNNWIRMRADYGVYWEDRGIGILSAQEGGRNFITNWSECMLEFYGGGVRWNDASIVTAAGGGGADVGYCVHHRGIRNGAVWLGWSDGAWRIDGAGYTPIVYGDFVDISSRKGKKDIRRVERDKTKIKRLRPVKFKRERPEKEKWEAEVAAGVWRDEGFNAWARAQEEEDWAGFIAEELADVIPEAVARGADGVIGGVRYGPILAYLVDLVQELDDRLDRLEK